MALNGNNGNGDHRLAVIEQALADQQAETDRRIKALDQTMVEVLRALGTGLEAMEQMGVRLGTGLEALDRMAARLERLYEQRRSPNYFPAQN